MYETSGTVTISNALPGQNGSVDFTLPVKANPNTSIIPGGRGYVAIAIDADGNTSELSACKAYVNNGILFSNSFE